jgi:hypothetical protein
MNPRTLTLFALVFAITSPVLGQTRPVLQALESEVSGAEIQKSLEAINVDRTSGSQGEREAFAHLERKLREYGVPSTRHDARLFLSWPGRAELAVLGAEGFATKGITPAFAAPTPAAGLTAEVVVLPDAALAGDVFAPFGPEVRGKLVVVPGAMMAESVLLRAQRAGAAGVIQVNEGEILHEDIATSIWGTPTPDSASRLPAIPFICIRQSDGERLKAAAARGVVRAQLTTETTRGWRAIPMITADVRGTSPDFVLVATHVDAWYRGMTDTGGSVASILEMARVLQKHQGELQRGVRFAWWTGHSFARYGGSTWYVDRNWADLDEHCVAYTNLDGPGRRGSRMDAVSAGGWPGMAEFSREFAAQLTGKTISAPPSGRLFRPGRDSDSSFQGIGVPFFSIGVPGPPRGHPDLEPSGRIKYWHTAEDTIEKLDMRALELDTKYRVAQLYELATMRVLPHRLAPIAASYVAALAELSQVAGAAFDLSSTRDRAAKLAAAAAKLDAAPRPTEPVAAQTLNRLLVRWSHRLNSTLYTKAGRFDQDPAAAVPMLPLLAPLRELASLPRDSDAFGFLETGLLRARHEVEATLREVEGEIASYLQAGKVTN